MGEDVIGGRGFLVADDGERRNFLIVPPGARLPPGGNTPDTSPTAMTPQVTTSNHDFAASLLGLRLVGLS